MHTARPWDIFCRVVDNFGDIGVCWRLAADLAARGQPVRLWVDDTTALGWMAPGALQGRWPGIDVRDWALSQDPATLHGLQTADAWIEAFGCDIPAGFLAHQLARMGGASAQPAWINLEYLSAEAFAQRAHLLPSPVMAGVAKGCTKLFYYPGFTPASGGLMRETDLTQRQESFDRSGWLSRQGVVWRGERLVSLFCYEPAALGPWLDQQAGDGAVATRLLVTPGRAAAAVRTWAAQRGMAGTGSAEEHATHGQAQARLRAGPLAIDFLAPLGQTDYDHLLWSCDLNFVRGEDSLVRAIWAGKPFVWQIYPQHDDAHQAKLLAALDALQPAPSLRRFHAIWNGLESGALPALDLAHWSPAATAARQALMAQTDLTARLQARVTAWCAATD